MSIIALTAWDRFQHYKDRNAPWVKLYRDMLTSESWVLGNDLSRVVQIASVMLAPRYSNAIPYRFDLLKKVMHLDCTEANFKKAVDHLVETNFFEIQQVPTESKVVEQNASIVLASCTSEERREEERREEERREEPMSTSSTVSAEDRIFEHWKTEYAHPKARLDPKRRKLITAVLKLYAEPDLIAAISGYKKSPHHMGDNDRHTVYDDIENFLRDAKHIDIGIALSSDRKSGNGLNGHAHFDASRDLVFKSEKEFSAYERAKKSGISFKSQQQWDEHLRGQH